MIPYIDLPAIEIGPLSFEPFGLLTMAGIFVGLYLAVWFGRKQGLEEGMLWRFFVTILLLGLFISHLINSVFYEPWRLAEEPLLLVRFWDGISSLGGVLGAVIGTRIMGVIYPRLNVQRWTDAALFGYIPGMWLGRVGCAIVHDHIGVATDFALAVDFPAGAHPPIVGPHHDLGLYEALFLLPVTWIAVVFVAAMRRRPDTLISATAAIVYCVPRFFLDFLRRPSSDPTYLGLTAAQYIALGFTAVGLYYVYRIYQRRNVSWSSDQGVDSPVGADERG